ncbi:YtxH domain-containing protein [Microbacterium azadirachtae]|uniref:YtxH domain-containing protein n=1 Tax=Microbacterium azadirachtae TaxID=582680 RepID=UPI003F74F9B9
MTFTDTLVATLVGALVGAVVGALAAWLFALDLRRRERGHAYADRLDSAVVRIVEAVNQVAGAPEDRATAKRRRKAGYAHDIERVLFAVSVAEILANSNDVRVIRALQTRILEWGQVRDNGYMVIDDEQVFVRSAMDTVRDLGRWRRREIDAMEAWQRLHRDTAPVVQSKPNPRRKRERPPR